MMQIARVKGKYYVYYYEEIKDIKNISEYFELDPKGNWEGKIILIEKKPPKEVIDKLFRDKEKKKKTIF